MTLRLNGSFTIEGGEEIAKMIEELGKEALPILRQEMNAVLDQVVERAKAEAPVDSGLTKETIIKKVSTRKGNVTGMVGVKKITGKQRIKLRAKFAAKGISGQLFDAFYSIFTNYGTKFQPPLRWMNKAFDQSVEPLTEQYAARVFARLEQKVNEKRSA